jgi:hypothetical protein
MGSFVFKRLALERRSRHPGGADGRPRDSLAGVGQRTGSGIAEPSGHLGSVGVLAGLWLAMAGMLGERITRQFRLLFSIQWLPSMEFQHPI